MPTGSAFPKRQLRVVLFYHSLISDWNHGNAHFLRGIVREFMNRNYQVSVYEPVDGWSFSHLAAENGSDPVEEFQKIFPGMNSTFYDSAVDLDEALDSADIVLVHEWNQPSIVSAIGKHRLNHDFFLFFHDTHHRSITNGIEMARFDLRGYDGVLAFGAAIRDLYLKNGWADKAWVWHEAADTKLFYPRITGEKKGDVIWVGNWGDGERSTELEVFLLKPISELKLRASVFGVRYPDHAVSAVETSGADYKGWLPNHRVPEAFSRFSFTVHIPRSPYVKALPGIPTIRVFEALACGIPLICSPWDDVEQLFTPGKDFLIARDSNEMKRAMNALLHEPELVQSLTNHGLGTIARRHTCSHRVDELLEICATLSRGSQSGLNSGENS